MGKEETPEEVPVVTGYGPYDDDAPSMNRLAVPPGIRDLLGRLTVVYEHEEEKMTGDVAICLVGGTR